MPFKLSVAIITYNEEKNLKRCLESVNGLWDELIIVDSGSEDETKRIAESFGAKFIHNDFEGHIQQKNFALDQCQFDMVLSLDADEALSSDLKSRVQELKQKKDGGFFVFNRMTNYRGLQFLLLKGLIFGYKARKEIGTSINATEKARQQWSGPLVTGSYL